MTNGVDESFCRLLPALKIITTSIQTRASGSGGSGLTTHASGMR